MIFFKIGFASCLLCYAIFSIISQETSLIRRNIFFHRLSLLFLISGLIVLVIGVILSL